MVRIILLIKTKQEAKLTLVHSADRFSFEGKHKKIWRNLPMKNFSLWTNVVEIHARLFFQDIKLPDTAGGYVYRNPEGSPTLANRTLYWRTMGDVLELSEVSLNYNLIGNKVKNILFYTYITDNNSMSKKINNAILKEEKLVDNNFVT